MTVFRHPSRVIPEAALGSCLRQAQGPAPLLSGSHGRRARAPGDGSRLCASFGCSGRVDRAKETAHGAPEIKLLAAPLAGVGADGVFEGYASLFGVADLGKDLVLPGAFAESLRRRGAGAIRMLWQHDPAEPIGRWLSIVEDRRGLRVRGRLSLAVTRARELHALMREGAVDGLSIGFRVERARSDRAGLRRLEKIDLWEISLVTFPMQPGARISVAQRGRVDGRWFCNGPVEGEGLAPAIRRAARQLRPESRLSGPRG